MAEQTLKCLAWTPNTEAHSGRGCSMKYGSGRLFIYLFIPLPGTSTALFVLILASLVRETDSWSH